MSGLHCCSCSEALDACAAPLGTLWPGSQSSRILFPCSAKNPHGALKSRNGMWNDLPVCLLLLTEPLSKTEEKGIRKCWLKLLPSFFCLALPQKISAEPLLGIQLKMMLADYFFFTGSRHVRNSSKLSSWLSTDIAAG